MVAPWQPFPVDCLPNVLAAFIGESASAIDCDPAFVALWRSVGRLALPESH